jgi:hypothetical protein
MVKQVSKKTVTETIAEDGSRKTVVKEHAPKSVYKKPKEKKMTAKQREELLIENFVGLQHAMTNMSIKFGALSDNISKLLQVFEEAAKNFVSGGKSDDKDMLNKIDSLLNQNKTIAKGLVLMEGKLRSRAEEPQRAQTSAGMPSSGMPNPGMPSARPKPLPRL